MNRESSKTPASRFRARPTLIAIMAVALGCVSLWLAIFRGERDSDDSKPQFVLRHSSVTDAAKSAEPSPTRTAISSVSHSSTEPLTVVDVDSNERFHQRFKHDLDRVDPTRDGWDTEAFSERAMSRLKALGHQIEKRQPQLPALELLLTDDFTCDSLRPISVAKVYEDRCLTVFRWQQPDQATEPTSRLRGATGLASTISQLVRPLERFAELHVHFKLYRVSANPDSVITSAYYQLGGSGKTGGVQQNATWHCRWQPGANGQPPRLRSIRVEQFEEVIANNVGGSLFEDCTEAVFDRSDVYRQQLVQQVDHWIGRIDRRLGLDLVATHGLAVGDVDGDGLEDIYLCEPGGLPNRLLLHRPDGTVRDISAVAGVDFLEPTRAALLLDLDNDGNQDLVIASDRFIVLMQNDGFGRFAQRAGFRTTSSAVSLAAADYDLDGDLDVYACGYFTMEDAAESTIGLGNPIPFHDANNGGRNLLLRNEGRWKFADATKQVGLDQDNARFSLAAAWEDFDNDGDPDLYVANDYGRNCLYRNDGGHFKNVASQAGVEDISAGMSASWGDYNQDGLLDIYVSNMFSSAGNRISYQRKFKTDASRSTRGDYRRFARGNSLFENAGDGTFRDVTVQAGVTLGRWAWSSNFADVNNDGREDLLVTNGMLTRREDTGDL